MKFLGNGIEFAGNGIEFHGNEIEFRGNEIYRISGNYINLNFRQIK